MISIVIPARNEEKNIPLALEQLERNLDIEHEIIVVNDHSLDNTKSALESVKSKYRNLKLVDNIETPGIANALKTGFNNASGEFIVCLMADLCDDISTINQMYKKANEGFDVVCGSRYIKGGKRQGGSMVKAFFSWFVGSSMHFLIGIPTSDISNAFKMYRNKVIDSINIESGGFEISMEIPLKAYYLGFKIAEVPTIWRERIQGKSSFRMFRLLPNYLKVYLWAIFKRLAG